MDQVYEYEETYDSNQVIVSGDFNLTFKESEKNIGPLAQPSKELQRQLKI